MKSISAPSLWRPCRGAGTFCTFIRGFALLTPGYISTTPPGSSVIQSPAPLQASFHASSSIRPPRLSLAPLPGRGYFLHLYPGVRVAHPRLHFHDPSGVVTDTVARHLSRRPFARHRRYIRPALFSATHPGSSVIRSPGASPGDLPGVIGDAVVLHLPCTLAGYPVPQLPAPVGAADSSPG
jgi:hypothetical protein